MALFKEDTSTAELIEAADRIFEAIPKNKISVTVSLTTSAESVSHFRQQINHLTSQMSVVLKLVNLVY